MGLADASNIWIFSFLSPRKNKQTNKSQRRRKRHGPCATVAAPWSRLPSYSDCCTRTCPSAPHARNALRRHPFFLHRLRRAIQPAWPFERLVAPPPRVRQSYWTHHLQWHGQYMRQSIDMQCATLPFAKVDATNRAASFPHIPKKKKITNQSRRKQFCARL